MTMASVRAASRNGNTPTWRQACEVRIDSRGAARFLTIDPELFPEPSGQTVVRARTASPSIATATLAGHVLSKEGRIVGLVGSGLPGSDWPETRSISWQS
jgi:hypothetical protein